MVIPHRGWVYDIYEYDGLKHVETKNQTQWMNTRHQELIDIMDRLKIPQDGVWAATLPWQPALSRIAKALIFSIFYAENRVHFIHWSSYIIIIHY